ncbi:class I SAM-dependent methyltransferase [Paenibacillus terrigena]|uniref:class I SAM-dependent methyltransferase n=1 Tax=Paenibacillus terrigena TaxID=369333 RepID=UPI0028D049AA|nr:class I SAM-dependent methyltransferase [Paenibacillus terrigena]
MENKEDLQQRQYVNSGNFNARIYLNRMFSTNQFPWPCWIFDQFKLMDHAKVLELGGGNGLLWMANAQRIPAQWEITVTDISSGMLVDARGNLDALRGRLHFEVMDAEQIQYPDSTFDIVIANHMLYHVQDRRRALAEIKRVLKPGGTFYASTVGNRNMLEMRELVHEFDPHSKYNEVLGSIETRFSLENGREQLLEYFGDVQLILYNDSLLVTESEAVVKYVLSLNGFSSDQVVLDQGSVDHFKEFIDRKMTQSNGQIYIQKSSGIFISSRLR